MERTRVAEMDVDAERARVRSIALGLAANTHPFIVSRVRSVMMDRSGLDAVRWRDWQTHWVESGLTSLERRLQTEPKIGPLCHGASVKIADICLCSIVVVVRVFGIKIADILTIDAFVNRCEKIDAFRDADPLRQMGAPASPGTTRQAKFGRQQTNGYTAKLE